MSDKKDIFSESFTGKYAHLADVVRQARARIKSIDEQLAALPKSPQPKLTQDGMSGSSFYEQTRQRLLSEKAELQKATFGQVDEVTRDGGKEIQSKYLDKTAILIDPKQSFVDKGEKDEKTEIESADYLAFKLRNLDDAKDMKQTIEAEKSGKDRLEEILNSSKGQKDADSQKTFDTKDTTKKETTEKEEMTGVERFNNLLSSHKTNADDMVMDNRSEQADNLESLKTEDVTEKETPEKEQMSGAELFEASLGSSYRANADDITKSIDGPAEPGDNLE